MNRAALALGSNIAPERNLPAAVALLAEYGQVVRVSRVWESSPVGFAQQPNFLNAAVLLATPLSARELCDRAIPEVERRLGRVRDPDNRNAPRTIDVDVAFFNDEQRTIDHRRIPDPEVLERAFLAVCLAELDPGYRHPVNGRTLSEVAAGLRARSTPGALTVRTDVVLLPGGDGIPPSDA